MKVILGGLAPVEFFDPTTRELVMIAKALTDSGFNVSVSEDVVRGGSGNARQGSYFYDSNVGLTLVDSAFELKYLSKKLGSVVEAGGDLFTIEKVTTTVLGTITLAEHTPVAPFSDSTVIYGWYKLSTEDDSAYELIEFTGLNATVDGLASGSTVCVKYAYTSESAKSFTISSVITPDVLYALMKIPELKAGSTTGATVSSSVVGELQVKIPQFQLDPNSDLSLTSSGHATNSLSGNALINESSDCSSTGYYAEIVENIFGAGEFDNVSNIVIPDSVIDLEVGDTQTLKVYKIYNDGTANKLIDNSKLTFVSDTPATATISATGLLTAIGSGITNISVIVTDETSLDATALVTVA